MKFPTNYSLTNYIYIHLNVCEQMTDFLIELFVFT